MKRSTKWFVSLTAILALIVPLAIACDSNNAATMASCAFVVGDGSNDHDAKLHKIVYPGQQTHVGNNEKISFVPCNSRNFLINDGTVYNANGDQLGDRHQPIIATTSTGVQIKIQVSAYWTLNQSKSAMEKFYTVCFKFQCASPNDIGGDVNYSSKGWNGMLAEDFAPALDRVAQAAAFKANDDIWQKHDPAQYKALSDAMSANFADVVRATLGFQDDIFCGSGNSNWDNPNNPGDGNFTCSPVRIVVDDVQCKDCESAASNAGVATLNQQRLTNAQALYGSDASYWLGLQDVIDKCKQAGASCVFNIGNSGSTSAVPIPVPTPSQ